MALFVALCQDIDDGFGRRAAARAAHLAYVQAQPAGFIRLAGPFLDEQGRMCGSMLVFEAEDRAAVDAFFAGDPYVAAGLFARLEIRPWRVSVPWT